MDLSASRLTSLAKLHPTRRVWLDSFENLRWTWAKDMGLGELIQVEDVVLIAGGSPGVDTFVVNEPLPAHTIILNDNPQHAEMLHLNFDDRRGVTVVNDDPVTRLADVLDEFKPSILLLDLCDRLLRREVIAMLALPLPSLQALAINYGPVNDTERIEGIDTMLQTWHPDVEPDEDQLRWTRTRLKPKGLTVYVR